MYFYTFSFFGIFFFFFLMKFSAISTQRTMTFKWIYLLLRVEGLVLLLFIVAENIFGCKLWNWKSWVKNIRVVHIQGVCLASRPQGHWSRPHTETIYRSLKSQSTHPLLFKPHVLSEFEFTYIHSLDPYTSPVETHPGSEMADKHT